MNFLIPASCFPATVVNFSRGTGAFAVVVYDVCFLFVAICVFDRKVHLAENDMCFLKLRLIAPAFSEVFKARCKKTGRIVALKKILMENEKEGVSASFFPLFFFCR